VKIKTYDITTLSMLWTGNFALAKTVMTMFKYSQCYNDLI